MPRPALTLSRFLDVSAEKHGDAYDYSKVVLEGCKVKVKITCIKHKLEFTQLPNAHMDGRGCPVCRYEKSSSAMRKTTSEYIKEAQGIHGDKYNYNEVVYTGAFNKVKIWCSQHSGFFEQTAGGHLSNGGCNHCGRIQGYKTSTLDFEDFLVRARNAHEDKYTYENVKYVYNHVPVKVTCKTHGDFPISPSNLFLGKGCPDCASYGYNKSKPGSIYVLSSEDITKVGITNRDVNLRIAEINKSSGKDFVTLFTYKSEDGCLPLSIEWVVKLFLKNEYEGVGEQYDGYTECYKNVDRIELVNHIKQQILNIERQYDDYRPIYEFGTPQT